MLHVSVHPTTSTRFSKRLIPLVFFLGMTHAAGAQGLDDMNRQASAIVGASFGDGKTAPALSATLDFWFTRRVALEFELAYARKLDFTLDLCPSPRVCVAGGQIPVTGRTVSLVPHIVLDLAPARARVRPYVVAGVGLTHLRQWYQLDPSTQRKRSKKAAALSFGGGVAVSLSRRVTLGADVRSSRFFDDEPDPDRFILPAGTITTLRVGSRVSWWF